MGKTSGKSCKAVRRSGPRKPTAALLRVTAGSMLPFLQTVARNRRFAAAWSKAIVKGDLDRMIALLRPVAPDLIRNGLGTNGIGYFFSCPKPWSEYSCGTTIPPGSVQFHFSPVMHRRIAALLIPYYRRLLKQPVYAAALARAIRRGEQRTAERLIKREICSSLLRSVCVKDGELRLTFKARKSKYVYAHLLFPFLE